MGAGHYDRAWPDDREWPAPPASAAPPDPTPPTPRFGLDLNRVVALVASAAITLARPNEYAANTLVRAKEYEDYLRTGKTR